MTKPLEVFKVFLKLGLTSFGGPVAHLGYFRKELIEKREWLDDYQYTQLLSICQFLPGPASSQLGFCLGLVRGGWLGAIAAFLAFTLPSAILLVVFSSLLPLLENETGVAVIHGLKIVAFAVVIDALLGMLKKLCPDKQRKMIALSSICGLLLFDSPYTQIFIVFLSAILGLVLCKSSPEKNTTLIPIYYGRKLGSLFLFLFFGLLFLLPFLTSLENSYVNLSNIFYQAGALVFGGGHVVLPLLEESLVGSSQLSNEAFLAGYGASQAIPGPMFSFSAYLGAIIPTGAHFSIGAMIALLSMFIPGFLLVCGVLPYWRVISEFRAVANAILGINAAVVGLLGAALYDPIFTSAILKPVDLAIGLVGLSLLKIWQLSTLVVIVWCVSASVMVSTFL